MFLHILYPDILQIWKLDDATLAPLSILRNTQISAAVNEKPISSDITMTNHATVLIFTSIPMFLWSQNTTKILTKRFIVFFNI